MLFLYLWYVHVMCNNYLPGINNEKKTSDNCEWGKNVNIFFPIVLRTFVIG